MAYSLAFNSEFEKIFKDTVSKLTNKPVSKNAYYDALDKMIIHHAETAKNPNAVKELKEDQISRAISKQYKSPPAFNIINGRGVWLRTFVLKKGDPKTLTGALMHEATHLAGAPGDLLAELLSNGLVKFLGVTGNNR